MFYIKEKEIFYNKNWNYNAMLLLMLTKHIFCYSCVKYFFKMWSICDNSDADGVFSPAKLEPALSMATIKLDVNYRTCWNSREVCLICPYFMSCLDLLQIHVQHALVYNYAFEWMSM